MNLVKFKCDHCEKDMGFFDEPEESVPSVEIKLTILCLDCEKKTTKKENENE